MNDLTPSTQPRPIPADIPEPGARPPGRRALALDFGAHGIRAAVTAGGTVLPLPLRELGLSPASLITFREVPGADGGWPSFPGLMERLGEDGPVTFDGRRPDKPHQHLRALLEDVTVALSQWWGPLDTLSVVVAAAANELQRSQVLKAAKLAGWSNVRIVNRTTALAYDQLQGSPPGKYLVLVLGHGSAEGSVVQWEANRLRPLAYAFEPRLSGQALDRHALQAISQHLARATGRALPLELYDRKEWLWLRERVEVIRRRLNCHASVSLEIPASMTEGQSAEPRFERVQWEKDLAPLCPVLEDLVQRCCQDAGVSREDLSGCLATGGLLLQAPVLAWLEGMFHQTPLVVCAPEMQTLGACRMAAQDETVEGVKQEQAGQGEAPRLAEAGHFRITAPTPAPAPPAQAPAPRYSPDSIIDSVRALANAGKRPEAKAQLSSLKEYIRALELSLEDPEKALQDLARAASAAKVPSPQPAGPHPESRPARRVEPEAAAKPPSAAVPSAETSDAAGTGSADAGEETPQKKAERRKYVLGKDYLKKAEKALKEGRLAEAVGLSHSAYQTSDDPKIFRAMIEVHLRAARKRPPTPQTFVDEARWLTCALQDDGTNEQVQNAVTKRFLAHVQQLVEQGSPPAHAEAIATLQELARFLPLEETARTWLQQLREGTPGNVRLLPPAAEA